ncbi:flagellar basal body FlgE domain-containing protein, partial [Escherichia coli]
DATPANSWKVYAQDGSVAGSPVSLATTLTFNASGVLTGGDNVNITTATVPGATPATFAMSFANSMQQNTGANNIVATNQNGYK